MIDLHSHLLWQADDGPRTIEESLRIAAAAIHEGITEMILTPHYAHPHYHVQKEKIQKRLAVLQNEIEKANMPLILHKGHEVRLTGELLILYREKRFHTLAHSNYFLLELPSYTVPYYTIHIIRSLINEGLTPIIAHPERNKAIIENPSLLERLVKEGAVTQLTAGSLTGHFGRTVQKCSVDLLKANLIHTYGSDVHNLTSRPFLFRQGLHYLEKKGELDAVDLLLENNARVVGNKPLLIEEPCVKQAKKWWPLKIGSKK
ncbi:tyrosine-protein phosphatase [Lysinibacillus odysseyi]|uniref:Tyrosine-protein phosphatase n=1 Tax=Lysinibacillus odysseyi 34hs-1 = NBRC 100172 TaxID=1220589 RepID=A0A0A3JHK6_9BACI|nr:CpsB/CapC family capsule biosynthesis tyrosine phosphatase [Lysinibacillus odysseyi]KGR86497.1 capsular biosynthesis protein [Lysinibacillus odysseyi 34hs-1 = NBRC 100172]